MEREENALLRSRLLRTHRQLASANAKITAERRRNKQWSTFSIADWLARWPNMLDVMDDWRSDQP